MPALGALGLAAEAPPVVDDAPVLLEAPMLLDDPAVLGLLIVPLGLVALGSVAEV
jgi:hypothetical protein